MADGQRFIVWCEVSGGVTGYNAAALKNKDGSVRYFDTYAEAEAEARRCQEWANLPPRGLACFRYTATETSR